MSRLSFMKTKAPDRGEVESLFEGTSYRGLERLGAGGMGEVFLVEHRQTSRICVAKLIHRSLGGDERLLDRARLEAQALGRLEHPHVVSVLGAGVTADGRDFFVLEHLKGRTLRDELKQRGALPAWEALLVARQILSALGAIHALGVVHRDLKPDNVFLCASPPGKPRVKVFDLGMARVLPSAPARAPRPLELPTEEGEVLGTPRYMSPEASLGRAVDERGDLYAVGLLLYEMLTGSWPFEAVGRAAILEAHALGAVPPASSRSPWPLPASLELLLARALAKDPAERPRSAEEFLSSVQELLESPEIEASELPCPRDVALPTGSARESSVKVEAVERRSVGDSAPAESPAAAVASPEAVGPARRRSIVAPERPGAARPLLVAFFLAVLLGIFAVTLLGAFGALSPAR